MTNSMTADLTEVETPGIQAAIVALLGVFWIQTSAAQIFYLEEPGNALVTATMSIDNEKYLADVHVRAGEYSSDTIFDYWHGYVATRVFSRNACFILKIEKDSIPELREIGRLAFEKQTLKKIYSPNNLWVQYDTGKSVFANVKEWLIYGKAIENLCRGLPIYKLVKTEAPLNSRACANAGIPSILGIRICPKLD
ncbi:gastrokine-2 [Apteryx rowi]|uniref:gastrokine-2 n=1 Tax=Apteryx rowi TaxID=308060 RepID=UPI000E1C46FE|nr:gastrokine-2 [Apteryx rowi]